jgi:hypothetical protein
MTKITFFESTHHEVRHYACFYTLLSFPAPLPQHSVFEHAQLMFFRQYDGSMAATTESVTQYLEQAISLTAQQKALSATKQMQD